MRSGRYEILKYLKENEDIGITSKEAFEKFGITRLASVIYALRKKYDIQTVMLSGKTRFGETCQYAKYFYRGEK